MTTIRFQIEAMETDLRKNLTYFSQLESVLDQYNDPERRIEVPFQFFFDLQREHEKHVAKLADKVK